MWTTRNYDALALEEYDASAIKNYDTQALENYDALTFENYDALALENYEDLSIENYDALGLENHDTLALENYGSLALENYYALASIILMHSHSRKQSEIERPSHISVRKGICHLCIDYFGEAGARNTETFEEKKWEQNNIKLL